MIDSDGVAVGLKEFLRATSYNLYYGIVSTPSNNNTMHTT